MSDATDQAPEQITLFDGQPKYQAFCRMQELVPTSRMESSSGPFEFEDGDAIALPAHYDHRGTVKSVEDLIEATHTSAIFVLQDGKVRFEHYWRTGGRDVPWMSMSVAKSFISALVGIACERELISGLDDQIADYVPILKGSGFDGATIENVLQMSSGVQFREDYADPDSEISQMSRAIAGGESLDSFIASLQRKAEPGTICEYSSADTQALGMLLRAVTGRPIAEYMHEQLCEPLGMESPSYWLVDSTGMELAFAGMLMTARDFAKIGELYRLGGKWGREQIVPAAYVAGSIVANRPHLQPGEPRVGGERFPLGYGYQWWIPAGEIGEFSAIGVYNQFVYVDPSRNAVVVKLSANPRYGTSHDDTDNKDDETIFLLRAICQALD